MPTAVHTHSANQPPLSGERLRDHLTETHDLAYREAQERTESWLHEWHTGAHDRDPVPQPTLTNAQPGEVEHSHEGYWPRSEEARFHLVHAHGYSTVQAFSLTLTQAELDHHTEHQPVPPAKRFLDSLRDRESHPIRALGIKPSSGDPVEDRGILKAIDFLRRYEANLGGVWVLLDTDGIEAVVGELANIESAGPDDQYLGAQQLAANVDRLLGVHS